MTRRKPSKNRACEFCGSTDELFYMYGNGLNEALGWRVWRGALACKPCRGLIEDKNWDKLKERMDE